MFLSLIFFILLLLFVIGSFKLLGLIITETINKSITGTLIFGMLSILSILVFGIIGFMCFYEFAIG